MSRAELVAETGLATSTILAIENGSKGDAKTKDDVAYLIADALGMDVEEIQWPNGLTNRGRRPLTGKHLTRRHSAQSGGVKEKVCTQCFLVLPVSGICGTCG